MAGVLVPLYPPPPFLLFIAQVKLDFNETKFAVLCEEQVLSVRVELRQQSTISPRRVSSLNRNFLEKPQRNSGGAVVMVVSVSSC